MVPQKPGAPLTSAMKGIDATANSGDDSCIDANGNTVCQVYKITVENTGSAEAKLNGTLTLEKGTVTNLKWTTVQTWDSNPTPDETKANDELATGITLSGSGKQEYYVVIWIEELDTPQEDTGTFTGSVSFNAADGSGVTSTFTV